MCQGFDKLRAFESDSVSFLLDGWLSKSCNSLNIREVFSARLCGTDFAKNLESSSEAATNS